MGFRVIEHKNGKKFYQYTVFPLAVCGSIRGKQHLFFRCFP